MSIKIFGGDRGGTGKTMTAQGALLVYKRAGINPTVIEVEVKPRLAELYPETVYIAAQTNNVEQLARNPDLLFAMFDEAMTRAHNAEHSIVCLGANLTQTFQIWAEASGKYLLGEGRELTAVIPMTMDTEAIIDGLSNLYEIGRLFPSCRRVAVLNGFLGEFSDNDHELNEQLTKAKGSASTIETLRIRGLVAPAWSKMRNMGSLPQIAAKDPEDVAIAAGISKLAAARSLAMFERWLAEDLFGPLATLLPHEPVVPISKRTKTAKGSE